MHSHKSFYSKLLNTRRFGFVFNQNESFQKPIHIPLKPYVGQAVDKLKSRCLLDVQVSFDSQSTICDAYMPSKIFRVQKNSVDVQHSGIWLCQIPHRTGSL